jgi:hypothetical protein
MFDYRTKEDIMGYIVKVKLSTCPFDRIEDALSRAGEITDVISTYDRALVDRVEVLDELEMDIDD